MHQLYNKRDRESRASARGQLLDIATAAGERGFETLVRALARSYQRHFAERLDDCLAGQFIKEPSPAARMLLLLAIL